MARTRNNGPAVIAGACSLIPNMFAGIVYTGKFGIFEYRTDRKGAQSKKNYNHEHQVTTSLQILINIGFEFFIQLVRMRTKEKTLQILGSEVNCLKPQKANIPDANSQFVYTMSFSRESVKAKEKTRYHRKTMKFKLQLTPDFIISIHH